MNQKKSQQSKNEKAVESFLNNSEMNNPEMKNNERHPPQSTHDFGVDDFISPEPFPNQSIPQPKRQDSHQLSDSKKHSNRKHSNRKNGNHGDYKTLTDEQEADLIRYNHISYLLYLLSFFTAGLTWIIAIFMNYYKRHDAEGSWLATHFDWQIKTFWYSVIMGVIAIFISIFGAGSGVGWLVSVISDKSSAGMGMGAVFFFMIAFLIFLFSVFWNLYRIVRGWIALSDGRPI